MRHDDNVEVISGLEADYDGEKMPFNEVVQRLMKATAAKRRCRVLCPFSVELLPQRRDHIMGRINGRFRGIFSGVLIRQR